MRVPKPPRGLLLLLPPPVVATELTRSGSRKSEEREEKWRVEDGDGDGDGDGEADMETAAAWSADCVAAAAAGMVEREQPCWVRATSAATLLLSQAHVGTGYE